MHTNDRIHNALIAAIIAEHQGHVHTAQALAELAAILQVHCYDGKTSYFGDIIATGDPIAERRGVTKVAR